MTVASDTTITTLRLASRQLAGREDRSSKQESVLLVLLPLGLLVSLPGKLYVADVIAVAAFPLLATVRRWRALPRLGLVLVAAVVWAVGQLVADVANATSPTDAVRGLARIATFVVFFLLIAQTMNSDRRVRLVVWSTITYGFLAVVVAPNRFTAGETWKFGISFPVTLAIVMLATSLHRRGMKPASYVVLGLLAIVHFVLNYRSQALIVAGTVAALVFTVSVRTRGRRSGFFRATLFLTLFVLTAAIGTKVYDHQASSGRLGAVAQAKYQSQLAVSSNPLLHGRSELYASSKAIKDNPLVGYGSNAKSDDYASLVPVRLRVDENGNPSNRIPSHSHLFGAWIESGIAGAAFWLLVLLLTFAALTRTLSAASRLAPLFVYVDINLIWDVLFSPFGAQRRLYTAFALVLVLTQLRPRADPTTVPVGFRDG